MTPVYVPWYEKPEWITVFVTVAYAVISFLTWVSIRRQAEIAETAAKASEVAAKAAQDSVKVAERSAHALINAERAWILIEQDGESSNESLMFGFTAKNWGHSPAEILHEYFGNLVLEGNTQPPETPSYGIENLKNTNRYWHPPGKAESFGNFSTYALMRTSPNIVTEIKDGKKTLWLYGRVRYRDAIAQDVHETRFCYRKSPVAGENLVMDGPPGYNLCT